MKGLWKLLSLAILLFAGAWVGARELNNGDIWLRVEERDLVLGVDVEGELRAANTTALGPPNISSLWNFKIAFMIPEGTEVAAGQPVLGFDVTELNQRLLAETATRDSTQKELEKRETDLEIQRRDLEMSLAETRSNQQLSSLKTTQPPEVAKRNDLEEARIDEKLALREIEHLTRNLENLKIQTQAELAALRAKRDRADNKVKEIEQQIQQMQVTAPRAGTVIYRTTRRNEKRKVGDSVWKALKVIEIPDLREMYAEGEIDEADAGRVEVGQPVILRLDAFLDQAYHGRVASLRRTVQKKSQHDPRKIVKLEIALQATDVERMRPGMRFRGTIEIERSAKALTIPIAAIYTDAEGSSVFTRRWGRKHRIFPEFGRRNGDYFEVLSGLDRGDRVLRLDATTSEENS